MSDDGDRLVLRDEAGREVVVRVHPATVPTTASPFHPSATHVDALGMPVAFTPGGSSYHPTPCCGAAASISDPEYGMYCKACYGQVDAAYGNVPVAPLTERDGL